MPPNIHVPVRGENSDGQCWGLEGGGIALIGNCLSGNFCTSIESKLGHTMLLVRFLESPSGVIGRKRRNKNLAKTLRVPLSLPQSLFTAICLERILSRKADGSNTSSTLTISAGGDAIMKKLFSTLSDEQLIRRRGKTQGQLIELSVFLPAFQNFLQTQSLDADFIAGLQELRNRSCDKLADEDHSGVIQVPGLHRSSWKLQEITKKLPRGAESVLFVGIFFPDEFPAAALLDTKILPLRLHPADGHVTLVFRPDERRLAQVMETAINLGPAGIEIHFTHLYIIAGAVGELRFLAPKPTDEIRRVLGRSGTHMTLGSTDFHILPPVLSRRVMEWVLARNSLVRQVELQSLGDELHVDLPPLHVGKSNRGEPKILQGLSAQIVRLPSTITMRGTFKLATR